MLVWTAPVLVDEALFVYKDGDKYGFINGSGEVMTKAQFSSVREFREGLAAVILICLTSLKRFR